MLLEKLGIPTKSYEIDGVKGKWRDPLALPNKIGRRIRLLKLYGVTEGFKELPITERVKISFKVAEDEENARVNKAGRFQEPRFKNDDGFTCVNREPSSQSFEDDFKLPDDFRFK